MKKNDILTMVNIAKTLADLSKEICQLSEDTKKTFYEVTDNKFEPREMMVVSGEIAKIIREVIK